MTTPLPAWLDAFRRRLGAELIETHISWLLLAGVAVVFVVLAIRYRTQAWRVITPTLLAGLLAAFAVHRFRRLAEQG